MNANLLKTFQDIKSIKIQGATNVALAVGKALKKYAQELPEKNSQEFIRAITKAGQYLVSARDTEPMADNVVEFIVYQLKQQPSSDIKQLRKAVSDSLEQFIELVNVNNQKIIAVGESLINSGDKIFTHCHSTTVIKFLVEAKKNKKKFEVFQTETRPLYQGHKTAQDLISAKIKDTLIVDSAAPYLISKISGNQFSIDKVFIGCDAISKDGSCVNKVGSYGLAMTAYLNKIPVYIVTQALKINEDAKNLKAIKIEERSAREVWDKAPKNLKIFNPAFDQVPAKFIKGYVTEFGLVSPKNLIKKIKKDYSWLW